MGYQKLKPDTFMYIPYVSPRNQKPAKIGMVLGNAAKNAFFNFLFNSCPPYLWHRDMVSLETAYFNVLIVDMQRCRRAILRQIYK